MWESETIRGLTLWVRGAAVIAGVLRVLSKWGLANMVRKVVLTAVPCPALGSVSAFWDFLFWEQLTFYQTAALAVPLLVLAGLAATHMGMYGRLLANLAVVELRQRLLERAVSADHHGSQVSWSEGSFADINLFFSHAYAYNVEDQTVMIFGSIFAFVVGWDFALIYTASLFVIMAFQVLVDKLAVNRSQDTLSALRDEMSVDTSNIVGMRDIVVAHCTQRTEFHRLTPYLQDESSAISTLYRRFGLSTAIRMQFVCWLIPLLVIYAFETDPDAESVFSLLMVILIVDESAKGFLRLPGGLLIANKGQTELAKLNEILGDGPAADQIAQKFQTSMVEENQEAWSPDVPLQRSRSARAKRPNFMRRFSSSYGSNQRLRSSTSIKVSPKLMRRNKKTSQLDPEDSQADLAESGSPSNQRLRSSTSVKILPKFTRRGTRNSPQPERRDSLGAAALAKSARSPDLHQRRHSPSLLSNSRSNPDVNPVPDRDASLSAFQLDSPGAPSSVRASWRDAVGEEQTSRPVVQGGAEGDENLGMPSQGDVSFVELGRSDEPSATPPITSPSTPPPAGRHMFLHPRPDGEASSASSPAVEMKSKRLSAFIRGRVGTGAPGKGERFVQRNVGLRDAAVGYRSAEGWIVVNSGINLQINQGEVVGLVGESGCGKTTCLRTLAGLQPPLEGGVYVDDGDILPSEEMDKLRRTMVVMLQDSLMFRRTLRDNICYGLPFQPTDDEVMAACEKACITDYVAGLEHGLDTFLYNVEKEMSGGQRQRVHLARVFMNLHAEIVVLDECTSALDQKTKHKVISALQQFLVGRTAFLITHDPNVMGVCTRVINLGQRSATSESPQETTPPAGSSGDHVIEIAVEP